MKVEAQCWSATQERPNYSTRRKTPKYGHNLNNMATILCKKQTPRYYCYTSYNKWLLTKKQQGIKTAYELCKNLIV